MITEFDGSNKFTFLRQRGIADVCLSQYRENRANKAGQEVKGIMYKC